MLRLRRGIRPCFARAITPETITCLAQTVAPRFSAQLPGVRTTQIQPAYDARVVGERILGRAFLWGTIVEVVVQNGLTRSWERESLRAAHERTGLSGWRPVAAFKRSLGWGVCFCASRPARFAKESFAKKMKLRKVNLPIKDASKAFKIFCAHYFSIPYRKHRAEKRLRARAHALSKRLPRYSEVIWMEHLYNAEILRSAISECSNRFLDSSKFSTYPTHHERRLEWDDAHRRAIVFVWAEACDDEDKTALAELRKLMAKPIYQSKNYTIDHFGVHT